MRITERQLRRIIREEIEGSSGRGIVVLGNTSRGPVYVIAFDRKGLEGQLDDRRDAWQRYEERNNPSFAGVVAGLTLKRTDEYGECNGAWQVSTAVSSERGWGTKVYLAAFEWLRNITSDRVSVSSSAEGLWKSLIRSGVVEAEPFDDWRNPRTPPTSDDCKVFPGRDSALNASYRLIGSIPTGVTELLDAGEEYLRSLGGRRSSAESALKTGIGDLFVMTYDG